MGGSIRPFDGGRAAAPENSGGTPLTRADIDPTQLECRTGIPGQFQADRTAAANVRCPAVSTGARLGTDVEGRGEGKVLSIPECRVVTGMVIGIADQDVENQACK